jgi:hypothetical protein
VAKEATAGPLELTLEHPQAGNDSDDLEEANESDDEQEDLSGHKRAPPLIPACNSAVSDLNDILSPQRHSGIGHNLFEGDNLLWKWLEMMKMFLWNYCKPASEPLRWVAASEQTAEAHQKGKLTARNLRKWARSFIECRNDLPINLYGTWNTCLLDKGELAKEIHEHLQGIRKYIRTEDIVHFLGRPEVQEMHGLTKTISLSTARRWMTMMDYRWTKSPSGQYVDGHECEDIVTYC